MNDSYLTIKENCKGQFKDKGSKFYAFAYPVNSQEEIKAYLKTLRSEYFDARHHCYAYVLGTNGKDGRVNDDGEPNHSAGDSIMRSIKSRNLTNTLIVVVRYFGGTKLGIRGLINAYSAAAEDALKTASILEVEVVAEVELHFNYESTSEVMHLLEKFNAKIIEQDFKEICKAKASVVISKRNEFEKKLIELKAQGMLLTFNIPTL